MLERQAQPGRRERRPPQQPSMGGEDGAGVVVPAELQRGEGEQRAARRALGAVLGRPQRWVEGQRVRRGLDQEAAGLGRIAAVGQLLREPIFGPRPGPARTSTAPGVDADRDPGEIAGRAGHRVRPGRGEWRDPRPAAQGAEQRPPGCEQRRVACGQAARARRLPARDAALLAAGRALFRTLRRWARVAPFAAPGAHAVARATGDLAWVAIGVDAWRGGRPGWTRAWAEDWLTQQLADCGDPAQPGRFLIQAAPHALTLDPPLWSAEDSTEGPSGSALLALAALQLGRDDDARAILSAHAGLLRRAPLAAAGLCLALEQVDSG